MRRLEHHIAPESVVALRLIFENRAALQATGRGWYISKVGATESTGSETIERIDVALTLRIYESHGIFVRYRVSNRDGRYIGYTFLGGEDLGAVDWREGTG